MWFCGYDVSTSASKERKNMCATVLGTEMWIWHTMLTAKSLCHVTQGIEIIYCHELIFITYSLKNTLKIRTGTTTLTVDINEVIV
jgi:hypothetical protein